ncbi:MAG: S8 family serine peptidase, partial [Gammaproteobacteria bacterium]
LAFDARLDNTTRENIRAIVSDHKDVLFVAAAGNDGGNVTNDLFPAALGGKKSTNVLTVASIDADDQLLTDSNRSADRVDLAAPGCKIQSWWDADGPNHAEDGTSQAAPFVSFAGALLWSVWPSAQPIHIKKRLVYSTDLISPESGQQIWSHGKLNIAKALLIGQDLIRYKKDDKEIVFLGDIKPVEGLACRDGHGSVNWEELNAFKLNADGTGWIYYSDTSEELGICSGKLASMIGERERTENKIFFVPKFQVVDNKFMSYAETEMAIDAGEIIEIVRKGQPP